jgi:hypothetical protein
MDNVGRVELIYKMLEGSSEKQALRASIGESDVEYRRTDIVKYEVYRP